MVSRIHSWLHSNRYHQIVFAKFYTKLSSRLVHSLTSAKTYWSIFKIFLNKESHWQQWYYELPKTPLYDPKPNPNPHSCNTLF